MAVPFPRKTLRYSKSGNSLFMAGSEKLRKILEAAQERVKDREKEEGGGGGGWWKKHGGRSERRRERGAILVGRKCPLGETRKREERRLSPDPIKRKRDPLVARPPLLRVDPRDSEPANKIQINSTVHTKLSHLPLPDRVPIPEQPPPRVPGKTFSPSVSKFQYFLTSIQDMLPRVYSPPNENKLETGGGRRNDFVTR